MLERTVEQHVYCVETVGLVGCRQLSHWNLCKSNQRCHHLGLPALHSIHAIKVLHNFLRMVSFLLKSCVALPYALPCLA